MKTRYRYHFSATVQEDVVANSKLEAYDKAAEMLAELEAAGWETSAPEIIDETPISEDPF